MEIKIRGSRKRMCFNLVIEFVKFILGCVEYFLDMCI